MINRALVALAFVVAACSSGEGARGHDEASQSVEFSGEQAEAVFAGGCFWCSESDFEHLPGVYEAISGYTGGSLDNPTYEDVITETTGHYESVRVIYDPTIVTYEELLHYFWRHIDPLDGGGQFCDRGPSYRSAVFVADETQRAEAEASKAETAEILGQDVATQVLPLETFWEAEGYHQDYYRKNPIRYRYYRSACGRDRRVADVWEGH